MEINRFDATAKGEISGSIILVMHLRRYTKVYEGIPRYTKVYEGIRRYTKVYEGIRRHTKVYEGIRKHISNYLIGSSRN